MPAVYHRLNLSIGHGGPSAQIGLESAAIRFPQPYDHEGNLSVHCRQWIIECVSDVAFKLMLCMCVQFGADDYVFLDEDGEPLESTRGPSGGLWI